MDPNEMPQQKLTRVTREIGAAIREQAGRRWSRVRTAERNEGKRHVWRFRTGSDQPDRFLYLSHEALTQGENPAETLLAQLSRARWLDRMQKGPEIVFLLAANGRLRGRTVE